MSEYAIGHGGAAVSIMSARRAEDWAAHLLPHLRPGMRLLDCGCGPGSITLDLARQVAPGEVVGIDREPTQVEQAAQAAAESGLDNVRFEAGDITTLPFGDGELDVVHAHMVVMHLADPVLALREILRVLKPGGLVAIRDTVIEGWWVEGTQSELRSEAFGLVQAASTARGGDWNRGRHHGALLREAGFARVAQSASYNYSGSGFENAFMGPSFAGMIREMAAAVVETGVATAERIEAIASAWDQLGESDENIFASAAGEAIGWKATD